MRTPTFVVWALVGAGLFSLPSRAAAQIDCGSISRDLRIYQEHGYQYVSLTALTSRSISVCPLQVRVEAWIEGVGGAGVSQSAYHAEVRLGRPVPRAGWWFGRSKHWAIWFLTGSWDYFGELREGTYVELSQEDACDIAGGVWVGGRCEMLDCPLLISTEGDKVRLTSAEDGVQFDLNADGVAERIAWTRRDADDAWLAMDRNGNGVIDDGSELFGTATPAFGDRAEPTTAHGFAALQFLENPSYGASRADGVIDAADSAYSRLLLWIDRNHNGFSEADELQRVPESNLIALFTQHRESRRRDRHGNEFRLRGRTRWQTGSGFESRPMFDVWLRSQP